MSNVVQLVRSFNIDNQTISVTVRMTKEHYDIYGGLTPHYMSQFALMYLNKYLDSDDDVRRIMLSHIDISKIWHAIHVQKS